MKTAQVLIALSLAPSVFAKVRPERIDAPAADVFAAAQRVAQKKTSGIVLFKDEKTLDITDKEAWFGMYGESTVAIHVEANGEKACTLTVRRAPSSVRDVTKQWAKWIREDLSTNHLARPVAATEGDLSAAFVR